MHKNNTIARDGVIHLYGARQLSAKTKYANNLEDAFVKNNTLIKCRSIGIGLSGFNNVVVSNNLIEIANESNYWKQFNNRLDIAGIEISTGDYYIRKKQSDHAELNSNIIFCNNNSMGILVKFTKNFNITQNEIYKPNSYGILYYANKNVVESNVGTSSIKENIIDMRNQNIDDLESGFFNKHYKIKFAVINFWRELKDNTKSNSNEYLTIVNNEIIISDDKINKIQENINKTESSNIYKIEK